MFQQSFFEKFVRIFKSICLWNTSFNILLFFKRLPLDLTSTHSWIHSNWQNNIVFICRLRILIINKVRSTVTRHVPVHISSLLLSSGDMVQVLIGTPRNACTRNHTICELKGLQRVYTYIENAHWVSVLEEMTRGSRWSINSRLPLETDKKFKWGLLCVFKNSSFFFVV